MNVKDVVDGEKIAKESVAGKWSRTAKNRRGNRLFFSLSLSIRFRQNHFTMEVKSAPSLPVIRNNGNFWTVACPSDKPQRQTTTDHSQLGRRPRGKYKKILIAKLCH